jgi:hypothetical protein
MHKNVGAPRFNSSKNSSYKIEDNLVQKDIRESNEKLGHYE